MQTWRLVCHPCIPSNLCCQKKDVKVSCEPPADALCEPADEKLLGAVFLLLVSLSGYAVCFSWNKQQHQL